MAAWRHEGAEAPTQGVFAHRPALHTPKREGSHTIKTLPRHFWDARKKTFSSIWKRALKTEVRQSRQTDKTMAGKFINWAFTLNNYTEQELTMIRSMPEFVKQCIWELEKGKEDTPHVQGWIKLKSQQRLSYLQRHYLPRAHYEGMTSEEWNQNMKRYVQKQDSTAVGPVVQLRQEQTVLFPAVAVEMIVEEMMGLEAEGYYAEKIDDHYNWYYQGNVIPFDTFYTRAVLGLIAKQRIELLVCRPDVKLCVRSFYNEICLRIRAQQRNATETDRAEVEIGRILEEASSGEEPQSERGQQDDGQSGSENSEGSGEEGDGGQVCEHTGSSAV